MYNTRHQESIEVMIVGKGGALVVDMAQGAVVEQQLTQGYCLLVRLSEDVLDHP